MVFQNRYASHKFAIILCFIYVLPIQYVKKFLTSSICSNFSVEKYQVFLRFAVYFLGGDLGIYWFFVSFWGVCLFVWCFLFFVLFFFGGGGVCVCVRWSSLLLIFISHWISLGRIFIARVISLFSLSFWFVEKWKKAGFVKCKLLCPFKSFMSQTS